MRQRFLRLQQRLTGWSARLAIFVVGLLPPELALRLGAGVGAVVARVSLRRAEIALVNLRIAFPEWSEERRRQVMRRSFEHLGRVVVEAAQLDRVSPEELLERTEVEGREHLDDALARSENGVLALTGHIGNWELLAPAMALRGYPITVVYRARANPYLEELLREWRTRPGLEFIARGSAARGVLRALKAGRVAALPMDQNVHAREGIFVPFFGRLACTRTGPARIAMRSGAPVLPVFIHRIGTGLRHRVRIHPPLELLPASEPDALAHNLRLINRSIEAAIREAPEQWTWNHRRWKTQPPGEPRPYRSKREPGPLAALLWKRIGRLSPREG